MLISHFEFATLGKVTFGKHRYTALTTQDAPPVKGNRLAEVVMREPHTLP
jgi:hypothetical protein